MKIETSRNRFIGIVLLLLLGISSTSFSQTNATVTGIVSNEAGGAIAGATITAVNEIISTGQFTTITSSTGEFSFSQLVAGAKYRFTVSYTGYKEQVIRNYAVKVSGNTAIRVILAVSNTDLDEVIVVG
jgi:hypothetical protein